MTRQVRTATSADAGSAGPPPAKAIREAQALLAALGYEPDPPDGQWGERTAQAYQAFVRDANLPKTNTLTPTALKTMRARARQAGAVSTPTPKALPPDALPRAAKAGNLKGLEAALAAGTDVNARDDKGWTALMYVVDKGYVLLVEPLLQARADPDVRAPDGATALFMAAAHGHGEIIPMLMKAGADPTIKGPKEKTATEIAQARYGDLRTAFEKGEQPAVIALLAGRTLGEGVDPEELVRTLLKRKPREIFRDCDQCPELVVVPAGRFRMGDLAGDGRDSTRPVHDVTIDYPFAVGRYEVTRGEFARFVEATAHDTGNTCMTFSLRVRDGIQLSSNTGWRKLGYTQTDRHPVVCISWNDAQAYVNWLSRKTGKPYRLLSEAEWEYVARAGSTTKYWWGNEAHRDRMNYGVCVLCSFQDRREAFGSDSDGWEYTSPVGSFKPNAFGLFDMLGNVNEWVEDCGNEDYNGALADGSAWTSGECEKRVVRGGNWFFSPRQIRSAIRFWGDDAGFRGNALGFRIARTLD